MVLSRKSNLLVFLVLAMIVLAADWMAIVGMTPEDEKIVSLGVTFDLVLVVPLLYYLCFVRKRAKSLLSVIPVVFAGYVTARYVLPSANEHVMSVLQWVIFPLEALLVCLELAVVYYEIRKLVQVIKAYRVIRQTEAHVMDAARAAVSEAFGDRALTTVIFHDVAVFYYSCLAWRQKAFTKPDAAAFTKPDAAAFAYHKESSWFYLMLMVSKLLILEGVAVHFLLQEWSHLAAWLVSASHVYLIILLVADYNAMRLNPVLVDQAGVRIRYGLRISADVPFSEIANVTVAQGMEIPNEEWETTVGPMFEQPNTAIELAQPLKVRGLFGIRREVGKIYLTLDKPEQFRQMIGEKTVYTRMI